MASGFRRTGLWRKALMCVGVDRPQPADRSIRSVPGLSDKKYSVNFATVKENPPAARARAAIGGLGGVIGGDLPSRPDAAALAYRSRKHAADEVATRAM
ncbi:MAG TPA: hypothetical protein VKQ32_04870 [Polyangia bacterium]|nr:hypothetical protein [Polyangia bacterium]